MKTNNHTWLTSFMRTTLKGHFSDKNVMQGLFTWTFKVLREIFTKNFVREMRFRTKSDVFRTNSDKILSEKPFSHFSFHESEWKLTGLGIEVSHFCCFWTACLTILSENFHFRTKSRTKMDKLSKVFSLKTFGHGRTFRPTGADAPGGFFAGWVANAPPRNPWFWLWKRQFCLAEKYYRKRG